MKNFALPLIGITSGTGKKLPEYPELYIQAVEKAGGSAIFLSPGMNVIEISEHFDGLIIPGGRDINPSFYNEEEWFHNRLEEGRRINFEISLLNEIIKIGKPVLGICYGMQLLNVFFKGSLYQDIGIQLIKSLNHKNGRHLINIAYNPFLERGEYEVNSTHHQAIKNTGSGLKPFAFAPDGIIEAFYLEHYSFLMGVQWHPERIDNYISGKVFEVFINASSVCSVPSKSRLSRESEFCRGEKKRTDLP